MNDLTENIFRKHVLISMSNGSVLEGFVVISGPDFIELIEYDNDLVVINTKDISFARVVCKTEPARENLQKEPARENLQKEFSSKEERERFGCPDPMEDLSPHMNQTDSGPNEFSMETPNDLSMGASNSQESFRPKFVRKT